MAYYMAQNKGARRGEIYYIANSKYYNTDPSNTLGRPGIIVSNDKLNENSEMVEVVYLTTKHKRTLPTHTDIICKVPSTALCETIYTVNKDRLGDFIRVCTDKEMEALDKAMLHSLGIKTNTQPVPAAEPIHTSSDRSIEVERNLYKTLYESLLNKVVCGGA